MYVELTKDYYFVQHHKNINDVSYENVNTAIEITDDLYDLLLTKKPWVLSDLDTSKVYNTIDIDLFIEIVPLKELTEIEKLKISQAEQFETILELLGGM